MQADWRGWVASALVVLMIPAGADAQGRSGSQTEAQQALRDADAEQKRGNYKEAGQLYRKAIQLNPGLSEAYERYSMSLFARKKFAEGAALARRGLQMIADNDVLKAQLGMHLFKLGKKKEAHGQFQAVIDALPERFEVQATASQCCLAVGDYPCAIKALRNFLTHRPKSLASRDHLIRTMLGTAYLRDGKVDQARSELEQVIRKHPDHTQARLAMAEVYLAKGDCSRAVAGFEAVRSKAAGVRDFHLKLGRAYFCSRRFRQALREANAHLAKNPADADAVLLHGDTSLEIKDYRTALADYRKAASLGRKKEVQVKIAAVYYHQKQYAAALRAIEPQLLGTARPALAELTLAVRAAIMSRQKEKALQLAERLLALGQGGADTFYYAGMAYSARGKFARALELYGKALAAKPDHAGARRETVKALCYVARAALRDKKPEEALAAMQRALRAAPKSLVVNRNLALAYLQLGKHNRALKHLSPLLRKTPNDFVANRLAGRAHLELGQYKRAQSHFARAVASVMRHGGLVLARALAESGVARLWLRQTKQALVELERARELAQGQAKAAAFLLEVKRNIARAHVVRASQAVQKNKPKLAWKELERALEAGDSLPKDERTTVEAAAAVSALAIGQVAKGRELLAKLKNRVNDVLAPPYNKIGPRLLAAYADYQLPNPQAKLKAATQLARLANKVKSPARERLLGLARSAQEQAAVLYFRTGKKALATRALARAKALSKRGLSAEQRHNQAVLAYTSGQRATAVGTLDTLKGRVPLAACNLAVHYEQTGSMERAYQLFRECQRRGAPYPGLANIVQAKQRIFGER